MIVNILHRRSKLTQRRTYLIGSSVQLCAKHSLASQDLLRIHTVSKTLRDQTQSVYVCMILGEA